MTSRLSLLLVTAILTMVFADPEYYQGNGEPGSEEYTNTEDLKDLFKSGEYLPVLMNKLCENCPDNQYYKNNNNPENEEFAPEDKSIADTKALASGPDPIESPPGEKYNLRGYKRQAENADKEPYMEYEDAPDTGEQRFDTPPEPEFFYKMDTPLKDLGKTPFAVPPVDPRYYQQVPSHKPELKRAISDDMNAQGTRRDLAYYPFIQVPETVDPQETENTFEEPRQQRQNPNLAQTKINKIIYTPEVAPQGPPTNYRSQNGRFSIERDIPTSLVPTNPRHQHVIQEALKNTPGYDPDANIYIYAIIAGVVAASTVAVGAFTVGWYTMRKKSKAAIDVEYPAYGVTGPNMDVTPSGDRQLAHSAQMYHYQHQKQQIIAMESRAGMTERNGSVSDAESEDENDEGDYTVYECPGFATTGEIEVKNPLFLDEPTPATPAQQVPASGAQKK